MVVNYRTGRPTSSASNFLDILGRFWQGRGMTNAIEKMKLLTDAPTIFDEEEQAHRSALDQIAGARRSHQGILDALMKDDIPWSRAVTETEAIIASLGRIIEAPEGSPGRKTRGPDKAPRRPRKGPPGDGPHPPLALSDEDRAVLRNALESYGPLTLLALGDVWAANNLSKLGMSLEEALTSTDEFCLWRDASAMETGQPDLWGTLQQFSTACDRRLGPLRDASWIDAPNAVSKLMDLTGCGAMAAKRVLDMAIARRVAGSGK